MRKSEYVQEVQGLDTGSTKRLDAYCRELATTRYSTNCDKHVLEVVDDYAWDKMMVSQTMNELKRKHYTQAWYRGYLILEQAQRFTEPDHTWFGWNKNYLRAKDEMKREVRDWNLSSLVYYSDEDIVEAIPRQDTHSGWEYILTGLKTKGENLEGIFNKYSSTVKEALECGYFQKPIVIGSRTQTPPPYDAETGQLQAEWEAEKKCKTRLVSMIDIHIIVAELVFGKPFQKRLGQEKYYAGGIDDGQINRILQNMRDKSKYWLSVDYSHYDQSISSWLIHDAFEIIREAFNKDPHFDEALFKVIERTFIQKVFIGADKDTPFISNKGVPSGSIFTQIVDTLVNRLMILTYLNHLGVEQREMMIMGDDNIIFTTTKLDREDISGYLERCFGIECNPAKCSEGDSSMDPDFLSRRWTPMGAWRHPKILLAKMTHPERFRDYNKEFEDGKKLDPIIIVYAYILSFPMGMRELIDVEKFELDNAAKIRGFAKEDLIHGSGSLRYRILYNSV